MELLNVSVATLNYYFAAAFIFRVGKGVLRAWATLRTGSRYVFLQHLLRREGAVCLHRQHNSHEWHEQTSLNNSPLVQPGRLVFRAIGIAQVQNRAKCKWNEIRRVSM